MGLTIKYEQEWVFVSWTIPERSKINYEQAVKYNWKRSQLAKK
jgi:hypothetical protein